MTPVPIDQCILLGFTTNQSLSRCCPTLSFKPIASPQIEIQLGMKVMPRNVCSPGDILFTLAFFGKYDSIFLVVQI